MNELASAEYAKLKPENRGDLLASGFGLRLLLSLGMALPVIARESSKYLLYLAVPFLTLEVLLAVLLVWLDAGLVAIALAQCAVWWLLLFSTWKQYRWKNCCGRWVLPLLVASIRGLGVSLGKIAG